MATLHRPQGVKAKRLVLIGAGKKESFSQVEWRRIAAVLVRTLKAKVKTLALSLAGVSAGPEEVAAIAEGALTGGWEPDKYKSDPKKNDQRITAFTVVAENPPDLASALERGRIIGEAQNLTRDLVNEPGNKLTPAALAGHAKQVAEANGLGCEILDAAAMEKLGMGALLGVAQGSPFPPFLIVLNYQPAQATGTDHLALVGKGVTFDTGGISIKPSDSMDKMKYDMAGAAAVIGAMQAIAKLKPAIPVSGIRPTVENAVGGKAQRPGDIVTTMSGKTVEILNTDAEGRLILADALTYANRQKVQHTLSMQLR